MLTIRKAESTDIAVIADLTRQLVTDAPDAGLLQPRLQSILASAGDRLWLGEHPQVGGYLHAFSACQLASAGFVEIAALVVTPQVRRQGLGRALVDEARQWAAQQGLGLRVRCNVQREQAVQFYRALGFQLVKQQYVFELRA